MSSSAHNRGMWRIDPNTGESFARKERRRSMGLAPRELTFTCYRRYRFFERDRARAWFLEALQASRDEWALDLWAWVLMPDHVHLLVAPREPDAEVGRAVGRLKERVSRSAIAWLQINAPEWIEQITVAEERRRRRRFWQPGGGYDRSVESMQALSSMIEYIHMNPVRSGLVARPEDWPRSSAQWYSGNPDAKVACDRTLPPFVEIGGGQGSPRPS